MKLVNAYLMIALCTVVAGCASQQAQERALQEMDTNQHSSAEEILRLQQEVEEKQAKVAQLLTTKQDLEPTIDNREAAVSELQKTNQELRQDFAKQEAVVSQLQENQRELEHAIEVQDQLQEKYLADAKQELEALYAQILELKPRRENASSEEHVPGKHPSAEYPSEESSPADPIFHDEPLGFEDMTAALQKISLILNAQVGDIASLQTQKRQLEEELSGLEVRLQEVNQLKDELEQVRRARGIQETELAKIKHEVLAVGEEIALITKALEEKFGKSLVVSQHQDRLVLTLLGQVLFESGEAELTPLGLQVMNKVGQVLATFPEKHIQVEGHTDNNPIYGELQKHYPTNWELSTARATTVVRYLIEQTGMERKQFSAAGYADTRPVQTNSTEEGRAQNRRVEIVLYPERIVQERERVATLPGAR